MKTTKTAKILQAMLTENTGRAMLDSGGIYGRNWERNQGVDFDALQPVILEFRKWGAGWDLDYTRNVYHFLNEALEYSADMDKLFQKFVKAEDKANDKSWFELSSEFPRWLHNQRAYSGLVTGMDESGEPFTVNTYNGEDNLSQVLQYEYFEVNGVPYVLLSIHGGCDVRGGYTMPRVFEVMEDGYSLFHNADGYIACDCPDCRANWSTDDTYHWYEDGSTGGHNLEKMQAYNEDDIEGFIALEELKLDGAIDFAHMAATYGTPEHFILINEDGTAICPVCGRGTLRA